MLAREAGAAADVIDNIPTAVVGAAGPAQGEGGDTRCPICLEVRTRMLLRALLMTGLGFQSKLQRPPAPPDRSATYRSTLERQPRGLAHSHDITALAWQLVATAAAIFEVPSNAHSIY